MEKHHREAAQAAVHAQHLPRLQRRHSAPQLGSLGKRGHHHRVLGRQEDPRACLDPGFAMALLQGQAGQVVMDGSEVCIQTMVSYFYGGREQLDLETAIGLLGLAKQQKIPGLVSLASRSIFAADLNDQQTMSYWKRSRKYSDTVAYYCATRMKSPSDDTSSTQETFDRFMQDLGLVEGRLFMQMLCPQVAPRA